MKKRNLIIASIIVILGVGGSKTSFPIGGFTFELGAIAVAALVGIALNLITLQTETRVERGFERKRGQ